MKECGSTTFPGCAVCANPHAYVSPFQPAGALTDSSLVGLILPWKRSYYLHDLSSAAAVNASLSPYWSNFEDATSSVINRSIKNRLPPVGVRSLGLGVAATDHAAQVTHQQGCTK